MKAALRGDSGLVFADVARPEPGPDDVVARVRAVALNRADLGVLAGRMHGSTGGTGTVLGMEWAGEVAAVGSAVTGLSPGDRVMGFGGGAFAEFTRADRGRVLPIPAGMGFEQAAALPVALMTMHDAVAVNGRLRAGESVLVLGASSGVGLMAMRIARHLGAARVIGTSTDPTRRAGLAAFGADLAIDTSEPGWPERVREATGGRGVELIIDQLAGPTVAGSLTAAAVRGRIVNVGRLAGLTGEIDFDLHALKRIEYIGVTFRTRSVDEVRELARRMWADLEPAVADGTLSLPVSEVFPFDRLGDAFATMAANRHFGKLVVTIG
ncbi:MAG: quinone oxidoreductase [Burkholderiales bacterium]|nr:MAG: quinone oxidoreductase [Burkholderiales bacterium]